MPIALNRPELTAPELYEKIFRCCNLFDFILLYKTLSNKEQLKAIEILALFMLKKRIIQPQTVLKSLYYPLEIEIIKAISCNITLQEFIAERVTVGDNTNQRTITRRWNRLAYLLQTYIAYCDLTDLKIQQEKDHND